MPAVLSDDSFDSLPHFFGGLVGESHREDLARLGVPLCHKMSHAMNDDSGLARPGAGQNQQRAAHVEDRLSLRRVEGVEVIQRRSWVSA